MKKILVCNALFIWKYPHKVLMEHLVYVADEKKGYMLGTEIDRIIKFLLRTDKLSTALYSPDGSLNLEFIPPISRYTLYHDGLFGRPMIPWEVWELSDLELHQQRALLKSLELKKSA